MQSSAIYQSIVGHDGKEDTSVSGKEGRTLKKYIK